MTNERKIYPSDVTDEEWSLVAPYLTLMFEDAPRREYPLREVFNGLRYLVRYGITWRAMPMIFRPGQPFISGHTVGWHPAASRRWPTIYVLSCGRGWADGGDHRQPNLLHARKRASSWLRGRQAQARVEIAYGR